MNAAGISASGSSDTMTMILGSVSAGTFLFMGTTEVVLEEMHMTKGDIKVELAKKYPMTSRKVRLSRFGFYLFGVGVVLMGTFLNEHAGHDEDSHGGGH